jgi:DNA-binding transcriptional MocR family regulator
LIARRLRARGASVADEAVIITNGAQQAIAIGLELVAQREIASASTPRPTLLLWS